jgi:hypothetical protein
MNTTKLTIKTKVDRIEYVTQKGVWGKRKTHMYQCFERREIIQKNILKYNMLHWHPERKSKPKRNTRLYLPYQQQKKKT